MLIFVQRRITKEPAGNTKIPFILFFWPSLNLEAINILSGQPNAVIIQPLTSKQQLCSVLLKGSLTQTVTLQRSAVSCSRKSTPRLVAHTGTMEQSMFVPIPFPPSWLIFTGRKCSACLAQEVGALTLHPACSLLLLLLQELFLLKIILELPLKMVLMTKDQEMQ